MRSPTTNYRIGAFTKTPTLSKLATLAHEAGILLYEDAGSGALIDFADYGITGEPIIRESFAAGADVISFSGYKLLCGPHACLLVFAEEVIVRRRYLTFSRALCTSTMRICTM